MPTSGLVAWYPFCGNVFDKSSNNRNLNLSGPSSTTDRFGFFNAAYSFNGSPVLSGNIISRTPPLPTDTSDFTYSTWFEADTTGAAIIAANGNVNINGYALITQGHSIAVSIGGIGVFLPTFITFHQWHQAVLRKTAGIYSLFLDTVIIGSFNSTFIPSPSGQSFAIGQDYTNGSKSFLGKIDDIAVYNRALSDPEIRALYHYNPNVVSVLGNDTAVCPGFSLTLSPSPQYPGLIYQWSTGAVDTSINVTSTGTYWFSITRPYGCTTSDTLQINTSSATVNIGNDTSVCLGDTLLINSIASAGSSYLWSTGDTTHSIRVHTPGNYWLQVSDGGCTGADSLTFGNSPVPSVHLGRDTVLCSGSVLILHSDTTYVPTAIYTWNTGASTPSIAPTTTGNYILSVLINGCAGYDTAHVTFKPQPTVFFGPDISLCSGQSVSLSGTGVPGTVFTWSTGDTLNTITVNAAGKYWLTAVTNGCMATDTVMVSVYPYPQVHLGPDQTQCEGTPVTLMSTNTYSGASYLWNTGSGASSLTVMSSGVYALTVTINGCATTDSVNVTFKPTPVVNLGSDNFFCAGAVYVLNSPQPAGATYLWSTGSTSPSINVTTPGLYGVTVSYNGCTGSDSIRLTEIRLPEVNLGSDTALCDEYSMLLYVQGDQASYLWSDGSTGNSYNVNQGGPVWVTVSNVCGTSSDTINIKYGFCNIWMPNAFTPNGDGKNDIIRVKGSLGAYQEYKFTVFNRWGVVVFMTDDINKGWDGVFNGQEQGIGTYYYMITAKLNGQTVSMKGDFVLVR